MQGVIRRADGTIQTEPDHVIPAGRAKGAPKGVWIQLSTHDAHALMEALLDPVRWPPAEDVGDRILAELDAAVFV